MAQLREIKKRIKAVANIQRITKTMQMIATAKFQASVRRAEASKPYTQKISEIAGELSAAGGEGLEHPLLSAPEPATGRELVLVLSSNRGLCGAYNANVLRTANEYVASRPGQVEVEVVGKKGIGYFRFIGRQVSRTHLHFTDKPAYDDVEALAGEYIERFERRELDAVRVVYMQFISNARQMPTVAKLLPLVPPTSGETGAGKKATPSGAEAVYEFSPDPASLLGALLPLTVKAQLFQYFNDAVVSEQIARMVAMKAATDNAGKMGRNLRRTYNRARQAQITTELTEIIGGAAALE